jgi:hypothetical protein
MDHGGAARSKRTAEADLRVRPHGKVGEPVVIRVRLVDQELVGLPRSLDQRQKLRLDRPAFQLRSSRYGHRATRGAVRVLVATRHDRNDCIAGRQSDDDRGVLSAAKLQSMQNVEFRACEPSAKLL